MTSAPPRAALSALHGGAARGRLHGSVKDAGPIDKYALYEASVQDEDHLVRLIVRIFREQRGAVPRRLREDFCGTALLAREWVRRHPRREAWGIDLDPEPLAWTRRHHVRLMGAAARRLHLVRGDVLRARPPPADVTAALNFSYYVFKDRARLVAYLRRARAGLAPGGLFVCDVFSGRQSMGTCVDRRVVPASTAEDGRRVPRCTYLWEQSAFNALTHEITCRIHFRFGGGRELRDAFVYDWRMWTVPEVCDALREAGFAGTRVYAHGWTRDGQGDGRFRARRKLENEEAWIGYVVGLR